MLEVCQPDASLVQGPEDAPRDAWGARLLCIDRVDALAPFLMTVVSDTDLWMYLSSAHGLTCGRREAERCLFPYETDDRLHRAGGFVGPVTVVRIHTDDGEVLEWTPFLSEAVSGVRRRLYKSELSDRVIFEETSSELGLSFRYQWASSEAHGFVRTSELCRHDKGLALERLEVLDGLLSIMPSGVALSTQQRASSLVNAYRRSERAVGHPRVATYALSAMITDRAEPAEALRCNAVWSSGLPEARVVLDEAQILRFRRGLEVETTDDLRGRPGSYLLVGELRLSRGARATWDIVADVHQSQADVAAKLHASARPAIRTELRTAIAADSSSLRARLDLADAYQSTAKPIQDAHHLANVLFNCMRGGVFLDDYRAPSNDVRSFIRERNRPVAERHRAFMGALPETVDCNDLVSQACATRDTDLVRLVLEYLPVTFSRRHGDPSRPWNAFSIRIRDSEGRPNLYYEGNWRDIFQNWEALFRSFPNFLPQVVAKFVNASTLDGFNPYRIGRDGIGWEEPDPEEPWSNFGYWGDHQIVYLTRLLEAWEAHSPSALGEWLAESVFSYADVPYRLRAHALMLAHPRDTMDFDHARARVIEERTAERGADGRLVHTPDGHVFHATLAEKLMVPVLAKLGQLVPDGGIWMNTQRPEWNDANNALAGYGLSMVTLCYLRRHLVLLERLFEARRDLEVEVSPAVWDWCEETCTVLHSARPLLDAPTISDQDRRTILDQLGLAFERYRDRVRDTGPQKGPRRPLRDLSRLFQLALPILDHAIFANRRHDGLYHAYNLLTAPPDADSATISNLYEMLEGQVAVLSAGVLAPEEAVRVLDALFESSMYRPDQRSFLLYPDRDLPGFLAKNIISRDRLAQDLLLEKLLEEGHTEVVVRDADGRVRFGPDLPNAAALAAALDRIGEASEWSEPVRSGRATTLETFEGTFHHHAFTGRSGTMFAYEGLGSIYWHMVSKLLLAVQENLHWAIEAGAPEHVRSALRHHYERVRDGLGSAKTAAEYGAFPTDPYSHTPKHGGAQQPGMTGHVKEEILTRLGEIGVRVKNGRIGFGPGLLGADDFVRTEEQLVIDFTVAHTAVRYRLVGRGESPMCAVRTADGTIDVSPSAEGEVWLSAELSQHIFSRDNAVRYIELTIPQTRLAP